MKLKWLVWNIPWPFVVLWEDIQNIYIKINKYLLWFIYTSLIKDLKKNHICIIIILYMLD